MRVLHNHRLLRAYIEAVHTDALADEDSNAILVTDLELRGVHLDTMVAAPEVI